MYAIITSGGRQIRVSEGVNVNTDKINQEVGARVEFPIVLKVDGENITTNQGVVTAEIVSHGKEKKIIVYKYKAKKNQRRKHGHRQQFTTVKILSIN